MPQFLRPPACRAEFCLTGLDKVRNAYAKSDCIISIEHVSKFFGDKAVLNDVNLSVRKGEFVTILGPSGCGKTTLLRLIAGFQTASEGVITIAGEDITQTPPHRRPVNTVFQKYALFPHLNVFNNIAFGLKLKKLPAATIEKKVKQALRMVGMTDYEDRDVDSLSGGQQQRVAIARAIVNEPEVLLLDEPLAALDLKMRKDMQMELKEMHQKLGITFVYVTHDQEEALTLSDTIVVMSEGRIQQIGTPTDIYNEPINSFVADFIGESNILNGVMVHDRLARFCEHEFDCVDTGFGDRTQVDVVIRPEDIYIFEPSDAAQLTGTVTSSIFKGVHYEMLVQTREGLRADGAGLPLLRGRPRSGSAGKTFRHPRNEERTHLQHFRGQAPGRNTRGIPGLQLRMQSGARHRSRNARNGGSGLPKRYPGG